MQKSIIHASSLSNSEGRLESSPALAWRPGRFPGQRHPASGEIRFWVPRTWGLAGPYPIWLSIHRLTANWYYNCEKRCDEAISDGSPWEIATGCRIRHCKYVFGENRRPVRLEVQAGLSRISWHIDSLWITLRGWSRARGSFALPRTPRKPGGYCVTQCWEVQETRIYGTLFSR
jgi:hypothetical protein